MRIIIQIMRIGNIKIIESIELIEVIRHITIFSFFLCELFRLFLSLTACSSSLRDSFAWAAIAVIAAGAEATADHMTTIVDGSSGCMAALARARSCRIRLLPHQRRDPRRPAARRRPTGGSAVAGTARHSGGPAAAADQPASDGRRQPTDGPAAAGSPAGQRRLCATARLGIL